MHRDRKENGNFQGLGGGRDEYRKVGKATQQYGCTYCHGTHTDKCILYVIYTHTHTHIYISVCYTIIKA